MFYGIQQGSIVDSKAMERKLGFLETEMILVEKGGI